MAHVSFGNLVMIVIGTAMIALAVARHVEPLLLVGIGFACIIANVPGGNAVSPFLDPAKDGLFYYSYLGIAKLIIPPLIFLGLGAMTDFGPVIANPKLIILGAGAQLGIFVALVLATFLGFSMKEAGAIGIIGGADGPLAPFVAAKLAPDLLGPVAVVAYASIALMAVIQPRLMRSLITEHEHMAMPEVRKATKLEKIAFPLIIAMIFNVFFPQIAPLMC